MKTILNPGYFHSPENSGVAQENRMDIKEVLKNYQNIEIELLLAHVLRKPKEFLLVNPEFILTSKHFNILSSLIKRRMRGEPMAYILGYKDFYGLRFRVNKSVLIPRPETEWVVERVISELRSLSPSGGDVPSPQVTGQRGFLSGPYPHPNPLPEGEGGSAVVPKSSPIKILDIGTGSGAIIVSLAKTLRQLSIVNCQLFASNISPAALNVAKQNAKVLLSSMHIHTRPYEGIQFIQSDLLDKVKFNPDIIIANLPYLSSEALAKEDGWLEWKNNTSAETIGLKFEPKHALFTGENGLMQIRRLLKQIRAKDHHPQLIYLEFDPRQKIKLAKLIKKILPGAKVDFFKDFNNFWRYAEIKIL